MLIFRIPIDPTNSRHLYRHLLRESSYLLPICRRWVDGQIRHRFRRHQFIPRGNVAKRAARRKSAYQALRAMRGAVVGDTHRLLRILYMVFGRIGKRRRGLTAELLTKTNNPTNVEEMNKLMAATDTRPPLAKWARARKVSSIVDKWNVPLLKKLAKSQLSLPLGSVGRLSRTPLENKSSPKYDKTNLWGKLHSERRKRGIEAKQWKDIADKILPPLGKEEWALLERLATDTTAPPDPLLQQPRRRRRVAKSLVEASTEPTAESSAAAAPSDKTRPWRWADTVTSQVDLLERQRNRRLRVISGAKRDGDPRGTAKPLANMEPITGRKLRRLMLNVWKISPKLEETRPGETMVVWGKVKSREHPPITTKAVADMFFRDPHALEEAMRGERVRRERRPRT
ncbi:uncharacterized protein MKZ38_002526 [Zalerion maritima]|uniref:LYR motif-containing protein Cup1-like N-terminal domain-containing protein n=1 Tax=Zalerion maritima TaxID=339359 RepID=A0AAD5WT25_9PEZI|nr:uncharacterized protein MKZ38_002526 [Zalerion maritima]